MSKTGGFTKLVIIAMVGGICVSLVSSIWATTENNSHTMPNTRPHATEEDRVNSKFVFYFGTVLWLNEMSLTYRGSIQANVTTSASNINTGNLIHLLAASTETQQNFFNWYRTLWGNDSVSKSSISVVGSSWSMQSTLTFDIPGLSSTNWKVKGEATYKLLMQILITYYIVLINNTANYSDDVLKNMVSINNWLKSGISGYHDPYISISNTIHSAFLSNCALYYKLFFESQQNVDKFYELLIDTDNISINPRFRVYTKISDNTIPIGGVNEIYKPDGSYAINGKFDRDNFLYVGLFIVLLPAAFFNSAYADAYDTSEITLDKSKEYFNQGLTMEYETSRFLGIWLQTDDGRKYITNLTNTGQFDLAMNFMLSKASARSTANADRFERGASILIPSINSLIQKQSTDDGVKLFIEKLGSAQASGKQDDLTQFQNGFIMPFFKFINDQWKTHNDYQYLPFQSTNLGTEFTFGTASSGAALNFGRANTSSNIWSDKVNNEIDLAKNFYNPYFKDSIYEIFQYCGLVPQTKGYSQSDIPSVFLLEINSSIDMIFYKGDNYNNDPFYLYLREVIEYNVGQENAFWANSDVLNIEDIFHEGIVSASLLGFDNYTETDKLKFDEFLQNQADIWERFDDIAKKSVIAKKDLQQYQALFRSLWLNMNFDSSTGIEFYSNTKDFLTFMKENFGFNNAVLIAEVMDLIKELIKQEYINYLNQGKESFGLGNRSLAIDAMIFPISEDIDYQNIFYFGSESDPNHVIPNTDNPSNYFGDNEINEIIEKIKTASGGLGNFYNNILGKWVTSDASNIPNCFSEFSWQQGKISLDKYNLKLTEIIALVSEKLKPSIFAGFIDQNSVFGSESGKIPSKYVQLFTSIGWNFSTRKWNFTYSNDIEFLAVLNGNADTRYSFRSWMKNTTLVPSESFNINGTETSLLNIKKVTNDLNDLSEILLIACGVSGIVTLSWKDYIRRNQAKSFLSSYWGYDTSAASDWWLGYQNVDYNLNLNNFLLSYQEKVLQFISNSREGFTDTTAAALTYNARNMSSDSVIKTTFLIPLLSDQTNLFQTNLQDLITTDNIDVFEAYSKYNFGYTDSHALLVAWVHQFFDINNPSEESTITKTYNWLQRVTTPGGTASVTISGVTFSYKELLAKNLFDSSASSPDAKSIMYNVSTAYDEQFKLAFAETNDILTKLNDYYLGFNGDGFTRTKYFLIGGKYDVFGYNPSLANSYSGWTNITTRGELDAIVVKFIEEKGGSGQNGYSAFLARMYADLGQMNPDGSLTGSGMAFEQVSGMASNLWSSEAGKGWIRYLQAYAFGWDWSDSTNPIFNLSSWQSADYGYDSGYTNWRQKWNWAPNKNEVLTAASLVSIRSEIVKLIVSQGHSPATKGSIIAFLLNQGPTALSGWTIGEWFINLNPTLEKFRESEQNNLATEGWRLIQIYNAECLGFEIPGLTDGSVYLFGWNSQVTSRHWEFTQNQAQDFSNPNSWVSRFIKAMENSGSLITATKIYGIKETLTEYNTNFTNFKDGQIKGRDDEIAKYGILVPQGYFGFYEDAKVQEYLTRYFGITPGIFMDDPKTITDAIKLAISGIVGDNPWDSYAIISGNGIPGHISIAMAYNYISSYNLSQIQVQLTSLITFYQANYRGYTPTEGNKMLIGFDSTQNNWFLGKMADPVSGDPATGVIKAFIDEQNTRKKYVGEWINEDYSPTIQNQFNLNQQEQFNADIIAITNGYNLWFLGFRQADGLGPVDENYFAPGFSYTSGWSRETVKRAFIDRVGNRTALGIVWENGQMTNYKIVDSANPESLTNGEYFRNFWSQQLACVNAWITSLINYLNSGYFGYEDASSFAQDILSWATNVGGELWTKGDIEDNLTSSGKIFTFFKDKQRPATGIWFKTEGWSYWKNNPNLSSHARTFITNQNNSWETDTAKLLEELRSIYLGFSGTPELDPSRPDSSQWIGGFSGGNWSINGVRQWIIAQVSGSALTRSLYITDWRENKEQVVEQKQLDALNIYLYGADGTSGLQIEFLKAFRGYTTHMDGRVLSSDTFAPDAILPQTGSGAGFGYDHAKVFSWLKSKANVNIGLWIKNIVDNYYAKLSEAQAEQDSIFKDEWLVALTRMYGERSKGYFATVYGAALQFSDLPGYAAGSTAGNYNIDLIIASFDKQTRSQSDSMFNPSLTWKWMYSEQVTTEFFNNANDFGDEQLAQQAADLASTKEIVVRADEVFKFMNAGQQNESWNSGPQMNASLTDALVNVFGYVQTGLNSWTEGNNPNLGTATVYSTGYFSQYGQHLTYLHRQDGNDILVYLTPDGDSIRIDPHNITIASGGVKGQGIKFLFNDDGAGNFKSQIWFWLRSNLGTSSPYPSLIVAIGPNSEAYQEDVATRIWLSGPSKINQLAASGSQESFFEYQYEPNNESTYTNFETLIAAISASTDENIKNTLFFSETSSLPKPGIVSTDGKSKLKDAFNGHMFGYYSYDTWISIYVRDLAEEGNQSNFNSVVYRLTSGNGMYQNYSSDEILALLPNIVPPKVVDPLPVWVIPTIIGVIGAGGLGPVGFVLYRRFMYKGQYAAEIRKVKAATLAKSQAKAKKLEESRAARAAKLKEQTSNRGKITIEKIHDKSVKK